MPKLDVGAAMFNGENTIGEEPHQVASHRVVRTFQIAHKLSEMTVLENMVLTPGHQRGEAPWRSVMPGVRDDVHEQKAELLGRVWKMLDFLDIAHITEGHAGNLSGGQRKLPKMTRALLTDPDILFLDESFAGVNPAFEKKLFEHVHEFREQDCTLLFVEYDMNLITNDCEHVIALHQGSVFTEGTPNEIQNSEEVIEAYFGGNI